MTLIRTRLRHSALLIAPFAFGVLTACSGSNKMDEQLKADLAAASQAPGVRGQFASPAELGYPQGYAPNYQPGYQAYDPRYPAPQYGYPQPYPQAGYPAPQAPQTRVVYVPQQSSVRRTSSAGSGGGTYSGGQVARQSTGTQKQKGAIIGAATGAAIGIATARDKAKGGAIGALGGAVLGGVIGHQIKKY